MISDGLYRGGTKCRSLTCTRVWRADGTGDSRCVSWHCAVCHRPSNVVGQCGHQHEQVNAA